MCLKHVIRFVHQKPIIDKRGMYQPDYDIVRYTTFHQNKWK